jgi:hypothetical protein
MRPSETLALAPFYFGDMDCPLENPLNCLYQVRTLMKRCWEVRCWYVGSELDSDRLPVGCVLLAAGLLASANNDGESSCENSNTK